MLRRLLPAAVLALAACTQPLAQPSSQPPSPETKAVTANPIRYVEIPVTDLDRATAFYTAVFGFDFERQTIDGYEMALFPFAEGGAGATGALAKGEVYKPSLEGAIVYFTVADIDAALARAQGLGAKLLYPKKDNGEYGIVAEIQDSEGNRIALHQVR